MSQPGAVRWWAVAIAAVAIATAFWVALQRVRIDSDLTATIPRGSPQLDASQRLLRRHPIIDRVVVDLAATGDAPATEHLVGAADRVVQRLAKSGLFASVGNQQAAEAVATLYPQIAENLPVLLGADDLREQVAPRLSPPRVAAAVQENYEQLAELGGIGQAAVILSDPLRLRNIVLRRLQDLAPVPDARIEGDHILSADGRHLLISALPHRSAGDPESSRRLEQLFDSVAAEVHRDSVADGAPPLVMTVAGAFRSAVDNERILKRDTSRALLMVGVGIVLLLLFCFRRPLLGLLALLPATAGVAGALLVYAVLSPSLSALALGFGAALVSITVDQGIVFVSFMDRLRGINGRQASREVLPATSLATLTTAGAFMALRLSGYPLLAQLGTFAALGVVLSFAFVHGIFPSMFRTAAETSRRPLLPVDRWLRRLTASRAAILLGIPTAALALLAGFARPGFDADLHALNTLTPESRAAEQQIRSVWGDVFSSVYVFLEADSVEALQAKADRLALFLDEQQDAGVIQSGWSPSLLYPGTELAARNVSAWRAFWTGPRQQAVRQHLSASGSFLSFGEEPYPEFRRTLEHPKASALPIPEEAHALLGIHRARDGNGWVWLGTVSRGAGYDADAFAERASAQGIVAFDGRHFGSVLGEFLRSAFVRMVLIIGAFVVLSVALAFWRPRLILLTLAPVGFGLVCTLGAMGLLNRPIGIPGLLLAIVIFGMGIDFAFHFMRGYQRHPSPDAPAHDPVRVAVLLASGSTFVGMLSLVVADHAALRSAGLAGALGIGFCALGTFLILPPLQRRLFSADPGWQSVAGRYRYLEPRVQIYARLKLRLDPMFPRLGELVGEPRRVLDVGCGYAVPAAWLMVQRPELRIVGVEPDAERARVADWALGGRGKVHERSGTDLPAAEESFDVVLLLDVAHYLGDEELRETLGGIHERLKSGGRLVMRDTVPRAEPASRERRIESWLLRRRGIEAQFRSDAELTAALEAVGFSVQVERTPDREETWFVSEKRA